MRDMNPRDRSIRDIPVSSSGHRRNTPPERFEEDIPLPRRRKKSRRFLWILLGIIVVCAAAGLLLATLFEGATVTITPKMQSITPPANLVALPNAQGGGLGYQTITLSQSATTTVNATGTTRVSKSASGVITISNLFSTAPQTLVTNTRFEASDGKIYKIHSPITIPGAKKNADGTLTAGTITTTVYADVAGPDYNRTGASTFTIPGFKGTSAKYAKITAQAAAGAIQGGFVGDQPSVSDADMKSAQASLQKTLDASLRTAVGTQVPSGFLPVQGSLSVTYSDIVQSKGEGTSVNLSQTAHASMAMVRASSLASILAKLLVSGYGGEAVDFASPNPLILQISTSTGNVTTGPLNLLLQGNPTLVWQFDKGALTMALLGKDKDTFEEVISTFAPAIEKAKASVRPFWKQTFPKEESKLGIVIDAQ